MIPLNLCKVFHNENILIVWRRLKCDNSKKNRGTDSGGTMKIFHQANAHTRIMFRENIKHDLYEQKLELSHLEQKCNNKKRTVFFT